MQTLVLFAHGKESGPWGSKIKHLAAIAERLGAQVWSPDYGDLPNPAALLPQAGFLRLFNRFTHSPLTKEPAPMPLLTPLTSARKRLTSFTRLLLAPLSAALITLTPVQAQAQSGGGALGIEMINIPAGSFLMGSCKQTAAMAEENKKRAFLGQAPLNSNCGQADPDASDNETPQHRVNVAAFQMGKTPVTLGQFKRYIASAGRNDLIDDDFMKWNAYGDDAPVVWVSWDDAQAFIRWLNQSGGGWRLPSEAEWEYACRAGGRHSYCGGNNLGQLGWYGGNGGNSGNRQQPVARKQPNAFGLYDMSGNVWEWVQDCWHDSYAGAPSNGSAWTTGECSVRVRRGGSRNDDATSARAAERRIHSPGDRYNLIGLRLARTR